MKSFFYWNIIILIIISTFISACNTEEKNEKYLIGVSMYHNYSWREKLINEMLYVSSRYPEIQLDTASALNNGKRQARQIQQMLDRGVKLLIVSPIQNSEVESVLDKAYDAGVQIIVVDNKHVVRRYTAFMGADNREIGRQVGRYICNMLKCKGRVIEVMGNPEDSPTIERSHGFAEILAQNKGMKLTNSRYCDWLSNKSHAYMQELVERKEKVDVVLFHSDGMVPEMDMLLQLRKINPDIKFVSIDALAQNPSGLRLIEEGVLEASFVYPTRGDMVIQLAVDILHGRHFQRETSLETGVVDMSNIQTIVQQYVEINSLDSQISQMNNDLTQLRIAGKQQRLIVWLLVLIVIFTLLALTIFYIQLHKNHKLRASIADKLHNEQSLTQQLKESNDQLSTTNSRIAQEVKMKMLFFTNLSHEIRTPLTLVQGPIQQLIQDKTLSEEQRIDMLELASNNLRQLCELSNEILDFQKLQNGKMSLQLVTFDLIKAINDWADNFPQMERDYQVSLNVPQMKQEVWVEADRTKFTSIFVNLVGNAFKFTKPGGNINVDATVNTNTSMLKLTIEDDGIGISSNDLPHIFDSFYQSTGTQGGTGIGLAITKQLVELHGGTISVESTLGMGTKFSILLPIKDVTNTIIESIDIENSTQAIPANPTVLVVEDNTEMRHYIRLLLKEKYNVEEACDGIEGYKKSQQLLPDLIISDVMMPGMDGQELCRNIKANIALSHIPVILLTARSLDEYRIDGYSNGADSYITKPFNASLLLKRIDNLLQSRLLLRSLFSNGSFENDECQHKPRESEFLRKFRDYINENLSEQDVNIENIAQQMCVSRSQLHVKIKSLTGKAPIDHLREARINRAKILLVTTDDTIQQICYATGFSSHSYFTKTFRNEVGMRPNEYRNMKSKSNNNQ